MKLPTGKRFNFKLLWLQDTSVDISCSLWPHLKWSIDEAGPSLSHCTAAPVHKNVANIAGEDNWQWLWWQSAARCVQVSRSRIVTQDNAPRPANQNSPDTGTTLHWISVIFSFVKINRKSSWKSLSWLSIRTSFKILFVPNPVGTQHQKFYFHFVRQLPPAAAVLATVWLRMWGGTDLWSWLTFIMVLPMLAVIKRYFLMMSANFRQPPTKCLVAHTHYKWYIYQEFKSHL